MFDSHRLHLLHKLLAEDPVAVAHQIARGTVPGKGFPELVRGLLGGGVGRDADVEDAPTVVR